jgi:hypothetical protein
MVCDTREPVEVIPLTGMLKKGFFGLFAHVADGGSERTICKGVVLAYKREPRTQG